MLVTVPGRRRLMLDTERAAISVVNGLDITRAGISTHLAIEL